MLEMFADPTALEILVFLIAVVTYFDVNCAQHCGSATNFLSSNSMSVSLEDDLWWTQAQCFSSYQQVLCRYIPYCLCLILLHA